MTKENICYDTIDFLIVRTAGANIFGEFQKGIKVHIEFYVNIVGKKIQYLRRKNVKIR